MVENNLLRFITEKKIDPDFWKELYINYDLESEQSLEKLKQSFSINLHNLDKETLIEIATLLKLTDLQKNLKITELINKILEKDYDRILDLRLLYLFSARKKRAIKKYYRDNFSDEFRTPFAQLINIFDKNPNKLIDIYTLHLWNEKNRGDSYRIINEENFFDKVKLILADTKENACFIKKLNELQGSYPYKIHSYYMVNKVLIVNIYKQKKDEQRADFVKSMRNREPESILFCISETEKNIEIKRASDNEKSAILNYFFEKNDLKFKKIEKKPFTTSNPNLIKKAFCGESIVNKEDVNQLFTITEMTFLNTSLEKSPKLTIKLENRSVVPAVKELVEQGIIRFQSLKNILQIGVDTGNIQRKVKVEQRENGNLYFSYNDSKMEESLKKTFEDSFQGYFGLPLHQEINNSMYTEGKGDELDYILSLPLKNSLSISEEKSYEKALNSNLIREVDQKKFICKSCGAIIVAKDLGEKEEFSCDCGHRDLDEVILKEPRLNLKIIENLTIQKLIEIFSKHGYSQKNNSVVTINKIINKFIVFRNEKEESELQFFIITDSLTLSMRNRLTKMLEPIIIISVGLLQKEIQHLQEKGFTVFNFGKLYFYEESFESEYLSAIEHFKQQFKSRVSEAADKAVKDIEEKVLKDKFDDYDDKEFEDDVYAILHDFVPNSIKWGKKKSGQEYPEGLLGLSYTEQNQVNRVFSYDCKLNNKTKNGYDLNVNEKSKAKKYIEFLNGNRRIKRYSDIENLSAHILIGNRFREKQMENMIKDVQDYLPKKITTKISFLNIKALLLLHKGYRENIETIEREHDLFVEELCKLFVLDDITIEHVKTMFQEICDETNAKNKRLATEKVKR